MKRLAFALIVWLALALPCAASTLHYNCTRNNNNAAGSPLTITTPTNNDGQKIELCVTINGTVAPTFPAGFSALTGTGLPVVGTSLWANCATKTASSEPGTYSVSWTGGASTAMALTCSVGSTDGSTPAVDLAAGTFSNSAGNINPPSVTTAQASDVIDNVVVSDNFLLNAGPPPTALLITQNNVSQFSGAIQSFGQLTAGATGQYNVAQSGSGKISAITVAWKSNTTTAPLFVGVGAEATNAGAAPSVVPTTPANKSTNDIAFASIASGTPGTAIYPPSDVAMIYSAVVTAGSGTNNSPLGTHAAVGDMLYVSFVPYDPGTFTAGISSSGTGSWTLATFKDNLQQMSYAYKLCTAGDLNNNIVTTLSGSENLETTLMVLHSYSGNTVSFSASAHAGGAASGTFTLPNVTPAGTGALIIAGAMQAGGTVSTLPAIASRISGTNSSWVYQYPWGATTATPSQSMTGGSGSFTWEGIQTAFTSGGALPWTQIGTAIADPTNASEIDVYWHKYAAIEQLANPQFTFATNPATSDGLISDFGNLDGTTPCDVSATLATGGMQHSMTPSFVPTAADELLFYATVPSYSFASPILATITNNRIGASYGPLSGAAAHNDTATSAQTSPFVTLACGLKAATTPTRTTAHALTNLEALEVFTSDAPGWNPWFF